MENLLLLGQFLEGKKKYYIETYGTAFDIIDVIKLSSKLVQKYGGHIYLGSDPGNCDNPFGLINNVNIHFSNGFVLCFNGCNRQCHEDKQYFESTLYFKQKRIKNNSRKKEVITEFFKESDYTFFELHNIDYTVGKEEEEFYWYNVSSQKAKAPCGFHLLTLSTLESYCEYVSKLNPNDFKLSRAPFQVWGNLSDKKVRFPLSISSNTDYEKTLEPIPTSLGTCVETTHSSVQSIETFNKAHYIESKSHNKIFNLLKKDSMKV